MNKQQFKELQHERSRVYQAAKSNLLMEVRAAAAVQKKRIDAIHLKRKVRYLSALESDAAVEADKWMWKFIKEHKVVRTRREKAERKRQAEIRARRRAYWKEWRKARRLELARRRMIAMNLRSVEARKRKAVATEKLLIYAPDYVFDLIGKTVRFSLKGSVHTGMLSGRVEAIKQHHGCIMLSIRVPHTGAKRNLYSVSLKKVIL